MKYVVTIDNFDGPLDLLLHLIKENNIDIYDIKIEEITRQYLDYIQKMQDLNLSVASEYLVMAAELIEMKSKMLLPKQEIDEDDYEEETKEDLIKRLLEYKKYKEMTQSFKELEKERKKIITREPFDLSFFAREEKNDGSVSIKDLEDAFNALLLKKELEKPKETKITEKELSVEKKIMSIKTILKAKKKVDFMELIDAPTKVEVIVSFLSILEMVKKNEIIISQEHNFKSIMVALKEGD